MRLYGVTMSPYVQRVLIAARLKSHELALEPPPGGDLKSSEFAAISATGRIPALEIAPGRYLCESDAIAAYLDETLAGPSLLPADPIGRARSRELAAVAHNDLGNGLLPVIVHDVYRIGGSADEAAAGRARIVRGLDAIERLRDPADRFATGDAPDWADAMLTPMLAFVALIDGAVAAEPLLPPRPGLVAYLARARADAVLGRSIAEIEAGLPPRPQRKP